MDEYEVGVELMRGRWEKGATTKSFAYVQLNKHVCFIFNISELCSYFAEDKFFLEVYESLFWNSKTGFGFHTKNRCENVLLILLKMFSYCYDRTKSIIIYNRYM